MGRTSHNLRRRRPAQLVGGVLLVFAAALFVWVRVASHDPGPGPLAGPAPSDGPSVAGTPGLAPGRSPAPSAGPSPGSGAGSPATAPVPAGGLLSPLPGATITGTAGSQTHSVVLRLTSDTAILRVGYLIRGGHPDRVQRQDVRSPLSVTSVAHGDGLVAEIAAQGGPRTRSISCTVTVDGTVRSHRTTKGGYGVVVCFG